MTAVTLTKHAKIGLPHFSNLTVGTSITWEIAEGEDFIFTKAWDVVNQQLDIQIEAGTDPSWIHQDETKGMYRTTIRTPKSGGEST